MRTTVTLDTDTERLVRERMRKRGVSFKQALNDAIREGQQKHAPARVDYVTPSLSLGRPVVSLDRALQLAADLEDDELVRKMRSGE